jgi:hypothetical protein
MRTIVVLIAALAAPPGPLGTALASSVMEIEAAERAKLALPALEWVPSRDVPASSEAPAYEAVRYQPRRGNPPPAPTRSSAPGPAGWGGATQLHGGFFTPDAGADAVLFGFRAGPRVGRMATLGIASDWEWNNETVSEVIGTGTTVGGQPVLVSREIAESNSHHVPLQGYLQLDAGPGLAITPYVGAGAGYQWLFLDGVDYTTGEAFSATFGNWGWQGWAGMSLRLGHAVHLNGEAFYNGAQLHRDTRDVSGTVIRETIDMSGVGGRFGLNFSFH